MSNQTQAGGTSQDDSIAQTASPCKQDIRRGWLVHCATALGAVCAMFGIISVSDHNAKAALLWLIAAQVLDGLDGPVARAWNVQTSVPRIDGYILDLVIDYVTCAVVPILFMYEFNMLPAHSAGAMGAFLLFSSALWFSRTDMMTADHWFNGFPSVWNLAIPTMYLVQGVNPTGLNQWINLVVLLILALSQLTNLKFVHPVQVRKFRVMTLTFFVAWLAAMLWLTILLPGDVELPARSILIIPALYQLGLMVWRTFVAAQTDGPAAQRVLLDA
jgi:phosphatidylcholine synthase